MTDPTPRPITVAIAALGGQGGGVLAGWIVETAEAAGYLAQSTSVPGVAQRTGATVYCVELFPRQAAEAAGKDPVLALMPMPGDVDIVLASEWMEAGRSIQRGFVTPDMTTLIASTHREYAISEKSALGDGIADADAVMAAARERAKRLVAFDMQEQADAHGGVISAALFGALAGSGALSIARGEFEETIRRGGRAVETNLAVFSAAFDRAEAGEGGTAAPSADSRPASEKVGLGTARSPRGQALLDRVAETFPMAAHPMVAEGVRRTVDYQDPRYAETYLDRLAPILAREAAAQGDRQYPLTSETARHLALWMTYEDTIRVADLKTRSSRFDRTRSEVRAEDDQIVYMTEFMHPRVQEIADTMPAPLGRWVLRTPWASGLLGRVFSKGRKVPTAKLHGFLLLSFLAGLRRMRRQTLRYQTETANIQDWLARIERVAADDLAHATQIAKCQTLVKGYGDTHARGLRNFTRLMAASQALEGRADAAEILKALRKAALTDEEGTALTESLQAFGLATSEPGTAPAAAPAQAAE